MENLCPATAPTPHLLILLTKPMEIHACEVAPRAPQKVRSAPADHFFLEIPQEFLEVGRNFLENLCPATVPTRHLLILLTKPMEIHAWEAAPRAPQKVRSAPADHFLLEILQKFPPIRRKFLKLGAIPCKICAPRQSQLAIC